MAQPPLGVLRESDPSAKLIANSKASFEANTGSQMSEDEEKKMIEKLRVRYPGVANK